DDEEDEDYLFGDRFPALLNMLMDSNDRALSAQLGIPLEDAKTSASAIAATTSPTASSSMTPPPCPYVLLALMRQLHREIYAPPVTKGAKWKIGQEVNATW